MLFMKRKRVNAYNLPSELPKFVEAAPSGIKSLDKERHGFDINDFRKGLQKVLRGSLDAAQTHDENKKHWRHADGLSARAAYSPTVRKTVRERSRHEAENNSFYAGMLRTVANHVVGSGPRLQVTSADSTGNTRLENAWKTFAKQVGLTELLRTAVESAWRDGQAFFLRRYRNDRLPGSVGLELCLYEADQVGSQFGQSSDPSVEDGIRLDKFGRALAYHLYDFHPGDLTVPHFNNLSGEWYPVRDVAHLLRVDRPGQIHGIPRITPALELFPKMRRHTLATLAAAEAVANWTLFVKTNSSAIVPAAMPSDFVTLDFARSMLNFLPDGWEPFQIKPEQPTTNHEMFQRQTLMEICRCTNFPYLLACGSAKDSNFASAKMDLANLWIPEVKAEQDRLATLVLERVWAWFLDDAVLVPGLLDGFGLADEIAHQWFFDPVPITDEGAASIASENRLASGTSTIPEEYALRGQDPETAAQRNAQFLGISVAVLKRAMFLTRYPGAATDGAAADGSNLAAGSSGATVQDTALNGAQISSLLEIVNQVAVGAMPVDSAKAVIKSAFPTMQDTRIAAILDPLNGFVPRLLPDGSPVPVATPAAQPGESSSAGSGPLASLGRRQFTNNVKATNDALKGYMGGVSEAQTRLILRGLGWDSESIDGFIADVSDGRIDSPELQGAEA